MTRMRVMAILIVLTISMPHAANAKCGLPAEIDDLVAKLRLANFANFGTTPEFVDDLRRLVVDIDYEKLAYALNQLDIAQSRGVVDYLILEAKSIAVRNRITNERELKSQIRAYDQLVKTACRNQVEDSSGAAKRNGISQIDSRQLSRNGAALDGSIEPPSESLLFLALLAPAIAAVLYTLTGGRLAYQWMFTFALSRRSCKIAATLESGLDIVDGHITVLGRKGCRFQPVDDGEYAPLERIEDVDASAIIVGPHRLQGSIYGLYGTSAVLYFDQQIKEEVLEALIQASTVAPKYVLKIRPGRPFRRAKPTAFCGSESPGDFDDAPLNDEAQLGASRRAIDA